MKTSELNLTRLKECRETLGISKVEAARRIGISQPAYLRYESGERTPSPQVIQTIANVFNTSAAYLLGKVDSPSPDIYIVCKAGQPILFELIESYNQMDDTQRNRLAAYAKDLRSM